MHFLHLTPNILYKSPIGAEEDRLQIVAPMAIKPANDHQLLPYPPKKRWWAGAMAKS